MKREPIEEYIESCKHPERVKRVFMEFNKEEGNLDMYEKDVSFFSNERIFIPEVLETVHAKLQFLTFIENQRIFLEAFLAGDGFFYHISPPTEIYGNSAKVTFIWGGKEIKVSHSESDGIEDYLDEQYDQMRLNEIGELCIPSTYEDTGIKNIGKTIEDRDFRKYNVIENTKWALQNSERNADSIDSSYYIAPGIYISIFNSMALELAYSNDPTAMIIDGILEYDGKNAVVIRN